MNVKGTKKNGHRMAICVLRHLQLRFTHQCIWLWSLQSGDTGQLINGRTHCSLEKPVLGMSWHPDEAQMTLAKCVYVVMSSRPRSDPCHAAFTIMLLSTPPPICRDAWRDTRHRCGKYRIFSPVQLSALNWLSTETGFASRITDFSLYCSGYGQWLVAVWCLSARWL